MNKKRAIYLTWKLWEEVPNSPDPSSLYIRKAEAAEILQIRGIITDMELHALHYLQTRGILK